MENEIKKKYADFDQLRNDLFWDFNEYDLTTSHFHKVKWTGYNDNYWWNNVATQEGYNIKKCECGKSFQLNYNNNEVEELKA